ncbi:MAG: SHOCT domain-containing protein [Candidatus Competibacterales bacterium]|nr:SHOCT domain-containing protein [Candidatus Competibacterales bacterium]
MKVRTGATAAIGALAGVMLPVAALANGSSGSGYGYHHDMMWGGGWFLGPLVMLLFLAAAVAVVVLVLRWLGVGGPAGGQDDSALRILEERFARGEIDEEEFRQRKRALEE